MFFYLSFGNAKSKGRENMKTDVFIIGAGISGLTAGVYSLRYGLDVYLCEKDYCGGQITKAPAIENYPAMYGINGYEFSERLLEWYNQNGGVIHNEKVESVEYTHGEFIVKTNKNTVHSKTVIAANGTVRKNLGCKNEDKFIGKGISWCAQCDGNFFKGKDVAVIGGGNTALGEALHLSQICNRVYGVIRKNEFRASNHLIEKLLSKRNVAVLKNYIVNQFMGNELLEAVELKSLTDGSLKEIKVAGTFEAIGSVSDNSMFISLAEFDSHGFIITNKYCRTLTPGLYAVGDSRSVIYRQLVTAASDGCVAASECYRYILGIPE